jgi:hypothetical protein
MEKEHPPQANGKKERERLEGQWPIAISAPRFLLHETCEKQQGDHRPPFLSERKSASEPYIFPA